MRVKGKRGSVTAAALKVLRDAYATDAAAVEALFMRQACCSKELAGHAHIQVRQIGPEHTVTPLGLVNGILSSLGEPMIAAKMDTNFGLMGFQVYKGKRGMHA